MVEQGSFLDEPHVGEFELPSGLEMQKCRSCGAPIIWITTEKGKAMPLDVAPLRRVGEKRYARSHFATCPDAATWRKTKSPR